MYVLIDYSNVHEIWRVRPLRQFLQAILEKVPSEISARTERVRARFYGGWFEEHLSSRHAQRLAPAIEETFPGPIHQIREDGLPIIADAELATNVVIASTGHFTHTFVRRSKIGSLDFDEGQIVGCASSVACPAAAIRQSLSGGQCSVAGCEIESSKFVYRAEQKLADTLLAVDLMLLVADSEETIVVVSDDADVLPAVVAGMIKGTRIVHVRTRANNRDWPHDWVERERNYVGAKLTG